MSQIEELQGRILAAMDRINAGVEAVSTAQAEAREPDADLALALDEEKLANAQLEERLKTIKAKHQAEIDALNAQTAEAEPQPDAAPTAEAEAELEGLRSDLELQAGRIEELNQEVASLKGAAQEKQGQIDAVTQERDQLVARIEGMEAEQSTGADAQSAEIVALDADLQRLRQANEQLRQTNAALREANEAGVGEPDLINKAMLAELEGLRATQAADAAEVGAVMTKLNTLLSNARNLPEGEEA
ncbi:hypothetical protein K3727_10085 [Rhodobacteraceae bacterium M382]|nr:hypothetical protein K3727_10085 [Rhodobacteraceae bacterium M382]